MKNVTAEFTNLHHPYKGLVIYKSTEEKPDYYVEAYDFNINGRMIDPHPLSLQESQQLAATLQTSSELSDSYLQSRELMPAKLLYTRQGSNGFAIWFTPAMKHFLSFTPDLKIPDGMYPVPPMLWKASRTGVTVFALSKDEIPTMKTILYKAPFFNVYDNGTVCMGTVDIDIDRHINLEAFMDKWEEYFFNSKFSHVLGGKSPVKGNIIQLWQSLTNSHKKFPVSCLTKHSLTIKNLIA
ncbi:MAG: PRTRC system protein B [Bacteroidota bacterium]